LSYVVIFSSAQSVQQTLPASYTNAKLGTALVTNYKKRILNLRTTAVHLHLYLHGTLRKERDKSTLHSQMADVK